jgi:thiamine-phosphate pyrophosphorylase
METSLSDLNSDNVNEAHPSFPRNGTVRIGRLHVLTDFLFQQRFNHARLAELVLEGGADVIQFRQKHGLIRHKLVEARHTANVCRRHGKPLLVNDHLDIALAVDADGIHLGQDDLPLEEARKIMGKHKIIGISTHTLEEAKEAERSGADYIGVGPVYATNTKEDVVDPVGLDYVRQAAEHIGIPFVAIGGIKHHNVDDVLGAGADRVCVVSGVVGASDVREAARKFREKVDAARQARRK